ncbi:putative cytochrome P450 [Rosellinia necatrix]|uniref:Putative cytochrome P450 n=1 Tax=Rosellinia necatrix TaxID=77044 RepID=A0A1W2TKC3_ROSNE|nr:putative cytochrome P450 [Rosellinia necatrix]
MLKVFAVTSHPVVFCLWAFCTGFLSLGVWCAINLLYHVRLARSTGLPFVILPFSLLGAPWQLLQSIVVPVVKSLPERLTRSWLPFLLFNEFWHNGYEPFERLKADTFLAVSPGGLILYTCDPDVNVQLFRDANFGKPTELLSILNVYGPTITGADGPESRLYRRVAGPFFSEDTLRRVFAQSAAGAKVLLAALVRPGAYRQLRTLSARLSLNTLNQVAFGHQTDSDLARALAFQDNIPDGKTLSYSQALHGLVEALGTIFLTPRWLLRLSPFRSHRHAAMCYSELGSYIDQLKRARESTLSEKKSAHGTPSSSSSPSSSPSPSQDLLDLLIQAGASSPSTDKKATTTTTAVTPALTDAQVTGQIFLFMFAGHEANANLLAAIILLLACHPPVQATLQRDLDRLLPGDDDWSCDAHHHAALMRSTAGAVVHEALRLFTVLPVLPKRVLPPPPLSPGSDSGDGSWAHITVDGRRHPLPPGTVALVNTSATHRHPKYWPQRRRPATAAAAAAAAGDRGKRDSWSDVTGDPRQRPYAVVDFDPARWTDAIGDGGDDDGGGGGEGSAGAGGGFLRPRAGTFVPFSEGARGCLGRRFALAEACAAVATLFRSHSVELVTGGDRRDGEGEKEEEAWLEARRRAALALSEGTRFTTSLRVGEGVPIRFVPRTK